MAVRARGRVFQPDLGRAAMRMSRVRAREGSISGNAAKGRGEAIAASEWGVSGAREGARERESERARERERVCECVSGARDG